MPAEIRHYISGQLVAGSSGRSGEVFNPATGEVTARVQFASRAEVDRAVAAACGNSFVLKPSERDPSASIMLAELLHEAGLPDGVFNVVHGDKEAVEAILTHPEVAAISSVGSTTVAEQIFKTASAHGKRVQ